MSTQRRRRYHRSPQREAILDLVRVGNAHPTAEQIFARLKHSHPRLAIGTVYRNLHILTEQNELVALPFATGGCRYDARTEPHYHAVCIRCGDFRDLEMPVQERLEAAAQSHAGGFRIRSHTVAFYGLCQDCASADTGLATGHDRLSAKRA